MKYLLILILFQLIIFSSCSLFENKIYRAQYVKVENNKSIPKSFDKTWSLIIKWFNSQGFPIKTIDKQSGLINSEDISNLNNPSNCDCDGYDIYHEKKNEKGSMSIIVEMIDNTHTMVIINTRFNYDDYYKSEFLLNKMCFSKGYLGNELFSFLIQD